MTTFVAAEDNAAQKSLMVQLIYPATSGAAMKAPGPIPKPQEVSGQVLIDIAPKPLKSERDRYLVEYYLDDQLIYESTGFDGETESAGAFSYILDTGKYGNGSHKLVVNFWDKQGQSAIGARELVINNERGD